jgi:hypothetical protein
MEFRSTNPEGFVHFGGDVMSGANSTRGVLLSSNTVSPVSDNSNENLVLKGKGTGGVVFGTSTTPFIGIVSGESTMTAPALAANAQGESTFTATGISTGDLIICVDFRNTLSTSYLPGLPYVGAADKIHVPIGNVHASTISASTGVVVRWSYIDRT